MIRLLAIIAFVISGLLYLWVAAAILPILFIDGWDEFRARLVATPWDGWAVAAGITVTATILLCLGVSLLGENSRR